jgi:hypothetical protein
MNVSPSGGEEPDAIPREEPARPSPAPNAARDLAPTVNLSVDNQGIAGPPRGRLSFIASLLLIALAFSVGLSYLLEQRWLKHHRPAQSQAATDPATIQPLLHVTAISSDAPHSAVVNGQTRTEGDSVVVKTTAGPVSARITKIEGDVVRFSYDGGMVDAKVSSGLAQENSP